MVRKREEYVFFVKRQNVLINLICGQMPYTDLYKNFGGRIVEIWRSD